MLVVSSRYLKNSVFQLYLSCSITKAISRHSNLFITRVTALTACCVGRLCCQHLGWEEIHLQHTNITPTSHQQYTCITQTSHLHHTCITPASHQHHTYYTPISHKHYSVKYTWQEVHLQRTNITYLQVSLSCSGTTGHSQTYSYAKAKVGPRSNAPHNSLTDLYILMLDVTIQWYTTVCTHLRVVHGLYTAFDTEHLSHCVFIAVLHLKLFPRLPERRRTLK